MSDSADFIINYETRLSGKLQKQLINYSLSISHISIPVLQLGYDKVKTLGKVFKRSITVQLAMKAVKPLPKTLSLMSLSIIASRTVLAQLISLKSRIIP